MLGLFALSYTPYQTGEFNFKYGLFELSMPGNFVLIICANILFIIITINKFFKLICKIFGKNKYKESQRGIIELLFSDADNINKVLSKFVFLDKYKTIRDGILCYLFDKFKTIPAQFFDANQAKGESELLYIREAKINIIKHLSENNIKEAAKIAKEIIKMHPKYVPIIFDQILKLAQFDAITIDPEKYKYNLSLALIEKYYVIAALKHGKDKIIKYNKKYPGNFDLLKALSFLIQDNNKFFKIAENCIIARPDRRIAYIVAKKYNIEKTLKLSNLIPNNNIEKLWFKCIANLEYGKEFALSNDIISIIQHPDCKINEITKFVICNYKKICNNAKIFEELRNKIILTDT